MTATEAPPERLLHRVLMLASVMLGIAALYWGRELFIPIALAAFLSLLLAPMVRGLERLRLGRVPSVLLVVAGALALIALIVVLVVVPARQLVADFRDYRHEISEKLGSLRSSVGGTVSKVTSAVDAVVVESKALTQSPAPAEAAELVGPPAPQAAASPPPEVLEKPIRVEVVDSTKPLDLVQYINPIVSPLVTGGLAIVFCIFFLIYREDLRDRILRVAGRAQINVTTAALADSARRVTRYVAAQALANTLIGATLAVGFYLLGIPNAPLWGLLSAVLRFVPYVGAFIAAAFPIAQSLAIFDGWWQAGVVLAMVIVVDTFSANFIEPWLYGSQAGASPTALLFSFVLWSLLWGGIGLVLATPITVCLVVLGKHTPAFEIFYILLGDEPALGPAIRFYQRLLALDRQEAVSIVVKHNAEASPADTAAQVILPALAQFESDRRDGLVDDVRADFARDTAKEAIAALKPPPDGQIPEPPAQGGALMILDRGTFDELIPDLLRLTTDFVPGGLTVLTRNSLATETVEAVGRQHPEAVVYAAIEPRDTSRLQHVLKRLRAEHPDMSIHVAVFSASGRVPRIARSTGFRSTIIPHATLAGLVLALQRGPWKGAVRREAGETNDTQNSLANAVTAT